jgi:hypothetical protein
VGGTDLPPNVGFRCTAVSGAFRDRPCVGSDCPAAAVPRVKRAHGAHQSALPRR